jgi:3-phenylpropionate/cinnamic acid dioxygenase small subunit
VTFPSRDDLIEFVYDEARMLDEGRFDDWLALWAPDSHYWMPLDPDAENPKLVTALMHEDDYLRRLRVERLKGARTFSQKPRSRCHHVLQRPFIDAVDHDAGTFTTTTPFHYVESRLDEQFLLAATARHELVLLDGGIMIKLKRVDLLNPEAAFGNIQLFL